MPHISPIVHVFAAAIGLLSGFLAMSLRKGSGLHGAAGTLFTISMLIASGVGAYAAAFLRPNVGNVMGSTLTFYLVATGWAAARRREIKAGLFDAAALLFVSAIVFAATSWGIEAAGSISGRRDGFPGAIFFVFATIAFLFALSDVRLLLRRRLTGGKRIARHLVRNSTALLFAMMSFYPGQARLFPASWRATNLLWIPAVLIFGGMLFWLVRVRMPKRGIREVHA